MKRALALVLLGFVVVWAAALFDLRGAAPAAPRPPAQDTPVPVAAAPADSAQAPRAQAEPAPAAAPVAVAPKPAPTVASAIARSAKNGVALIGKTARSLLASAHASVEQPASAAPKKPPAPVATGELGEGVLSPEFAEYEQRYATESRDGTWAPALEENVRSLLATQGWADEVGMIHCQQTLCRIMIETDIDAPNPFQRLLGVPGLREATGLGPDTPYSLRSGQFSVYFTGRTAAAAL